MRVEAAGIRLTYGSLLNGDDLRQLHGEMEMIFDERDRARRLAAHLEEVVAMRTAVLKALVEMDNLLQLPAIQEWAAAQLSEIP